MAPATASVLEHTFELPVTAATRWFLTRPFTSHAIRQGLERSRPDGNRVPTSCGIAASESPHLA